MASASFRSAPRTSVGDDAVLTRFRVNAVNSFPRVRGAPSSLPHSAATESSNAVENGSHSGLRSSAS